MFEKFLTVGIDDFHQRYHGTYGFYKAKDKKTLVRIDGVNKERHPYTLNFIDSQGLVYHLQADSKEDVGFEFIPPKQGYHNTIFGAALVRRVPARQYSRGINSRNTQITYDGGPLPINFDTLRAVFESGTSVKDAVATSFKSGRSAALSNNFAISPQTEGVYILGTKLGTYKVNEGIIEVHMDAKNKDMFAVELSDAFREAQIAGVIK